MIVIIADVEVRVGPVEYPALTSSSSSSPFNTMLLRLRLEAPQTCRLSLPLKRRAPRHHRPEARPHLPQLLPAVPSLPPRQSISREPPPRGRALCVARSTDGSSHRASGYTGRRG